MIIDNEEFVEWTESDLRFTGWEHECIIIDRSENHYYIPKNRYDEIRELESRPTVIRDMTGCGVTGSCGTSNKNLL